MQESQNVEWKESWHNYYLKWVCGFANAQGGRIYIGVKDDGKVIGVRNSKRLLETIPNIIRDKLGLVADVNLLRKEEKDYIEIVVNPWEFPVNYEGEYHYRSGSTKQLLRGNALTSFLLAKAGLKWDAAPVANLTLDELDAKSFAIFRKNALLSGRVPKECLELSDIDLLKKLNLLVDGKLTRAAALCFCKEPEKVVGGCYVKIGRFANNKILQQEEVHGSLLAIADQVMDHIYLKYLKAQVSYPQGERREEFPFPREAVQEAVFNALCHSNWGDNVPVQVRIEDAFMYVSNSCQLPFGWSIGTLYEPHAAKAYNPDIASVLYRAGFIDSWGTGVQRMQAACAKHGTKPPRCVAQETSMMVRFSALGCDELFPQNIRREEFRPVSNSASVPLADKILQVMENVPSCRYEPLVKLFSVSLSTLKRTVNKLKRLGKLVRIGGKKLGYWEVHREPQQTEKNRGKRG